MGEQKFKCGDVVKFVIKRPKDWYDAAKFNQLFCVTGVKESSHDHCRYRCINCQTNIKRKYNLDLDYNWTLVCYGGFVKASDREAFLFYTHGRDALIKKDNEA